MNELVYDLACDSLYHLSRALDLTRQESWDALMAVANLIAERYPGRGKELEVMMEIERRRA